MDSFPHVFAFFNHTMPQSSLAASPSTYYFFWLHLSHFCDLYHPLYNYAPSYYIGALPLTEDSQYFSEREDDMHLAPLDM